MAHYGLDGRVALVTGASVGLGEQFAHGLAESGADVVLAARRTELIERLAEELIERHGVRALAVTTDVAREQDVVDAVAAAVRGLGRLDILVNNAGSLISKPIVEQTIGDWHEVMDANLTSAFLASREAARVMIEQGSGAIVNVSSIFAFGALREFPEVSYYASKGGMISLTKALAVELGDHGIRVNAIAPGFFPTPMGAGISEELRDRVIEPRTCLPSRPDNEWIRGAVCFLASDDARFITGATLTVDGGWTAF
ncbi:MAG TPA: SDR family oxidoreductase [Solirubrobacterales bacterium]|nr:SDR family oxidoreductase [Solirubrobacterales bacterium]